MGKAKGKVDEKSLDSLKKKLKAGGDRKKATKKAKTPTPRQRSRSRSRGRPRKATPPPPPPPKKPAARKSRKSVKRLDDKPSSSSRTPTRTRGGKASDNSNVYPSAYKLRPRTPASSDHEISSSTKFFEGDSSTSEVKEPGVKATVNGTSGWLSRCVVM